MPEMLITSRISILVQSKEISFYKIFALITQEIVTTFAATNSEYIIDLVILMASWLYWKGFLVLFFFFFVSL